jgi:hypothetical protein
MFLLHPLLDFGSCGWPYLVPARHVYHVPPSCTALLFSLVVDLTITYLSCLQFRSYWGAWRPAYEGVNNLVADACSCFTDHAQCWSIPSELC